MGKVKKETKKASKKNGKQSEVTGSVAQWGQGSECV